MDYREIWHDIEKLKNINISNLNYSNFNYSDHQKIWIRVSDLEVAYKVLVYLPIFILGLFGNISVIIVLCRYKVLRTCTNLFILNMAVADFLVISLCSWTVLAYDFYQNYVLGTFWCQFNGFMQVIYLTTSATTLVVISLNRMVAIVFPLVKRITKKQAIVILFFIWVVSVAIAFPFAIWRRLHRRQWADFLEVWCSEDKEEMGVYWVIFLTLVIYVPVTATTVTYSVILLKMDHYEHKLSSEDNPLKFRFKKKIMVMLFVYLLSFLICWSMFDVVALYRYFKNATLELQPWYKNTFFFAHLLAYCQAAVNPIVFAYNTETFRRGFWVTFPCVAHLISHLKCSCRLKRAKQNRVTPQNVSRQDETPAIPMQPVEPNDTRPKVVLATVESHQNANVTQETKLTNSTYPKNVRPGDTFVVRKGPIVFYV